MSDPRALGPGDDDPRSPTTAHVSPSGPLGPGEDDPRSPADEADPLAPALGPGDPTPGDVDDGLVMLPFPSPPGPGAVGSGPRRLTHVPRQTAVVPVTPEPMIDHPAPVAADATATVHEET